MIESIFKVCDKLVKLPVQSGVIVKELHVAVVINTLVYSHCRWDSTQTVENLRSSCEGRVFRVHSRYP